MISPEKSRRFKEWYAKNREKQLAYNRRYWRKNKKRLLEKQSLNPNRKASYEKYRLNHPERAIKDREWKKLHRDRCLKWERRYNANNREKVRKRKAAWNAANRERCLEYRRGWHRRHKDTHYAGTKKARKARPDHYRMKGCEYENKRRARKRGATGNCSVSQWLDICERFKNRCPRCGATGSLTRDHIVPLSKLGSNEASNIQPLCRKCNVSKSARVIVCFLPWREGE